MVRQYTQQVKEQLRTVKELTSALIRRGNKQVGRKTPTFNRFLLLVSFKLPLLILPRDRLHLLLQLLLPSFTTQLPQSMTQGYQSSSARCGPNGPVHICVQKTPPVKNCTCRTSQRDFARWPSAPVRFRDTSNQRLRDGDSNFLSCCLQKKVDVI